MHRKSSKKNSLCLNLLLGISFYLNGCFPYEQIRTHYTQGEIDPNKVVRIVLPHSIRVYKVDGIFVPNGVNLDHFQATNNRVVQVFPGKHSFSYRIETNKFKSLDFKSVDLEGEKGEVYALCFSKGKEPKDWTPWVWKVKPEQMGEEDLLGFYHIYFKNFTDRFQCFAHADF